MSTKCQKCGEPTHSEEAWIDGQIWCHPCADAISSDLPYWNARIEGDTKTFGEHAREGLKDWAKNKGLEK